MDAVDVSCDVNVNTCIRIHDSIILAPQTDYNIINLSCETRLWTQIPEVLYVRNR